MIQAVSTKVDHPPFNGAAKNKLEIANEALKIDSQPSPRAYPDQLRRCRNRCCRRYDCGGG